MIKLKEVVEKYQDYEVDEEKLKEILVKPEIKSVWELNKGDRYYTISSTVNGFRVLAYKWDYSLYNKELRDIDRIFLTEEEAQFALERIKIEAILLKYGRRSFKYTEPNYYFTYDHEYKKLRFDLNLLIQYQGAIYFDTEELYEQAIDEAGEENIKKYLFMVTDNE